MCQKPDLGVLPEECARNLSRVSFLSEVEVPAGDGRFRASHGAESAPPPLPHPAAPLSILVVTSGAVGGACAGCVLGRSRVPEEGSR